MIPTSIDGTDITGATIDGTDVTEITVDGDVVFSAGPDLPASIAHRYDPSEETFSDGATVSTWTDQIGSADGTNTGSGVKFRTNEINGEPTIELTGNTIEMSLSSGMDNPFSMSFLMHWNVESTFRHVFSTPRGGFDDDPRLRLKDDGEGNWSGGDQSNTSNISGYSPLHNQYGIVTVVADGSNTTLRVNGSDIFTNQDAGTKGFDDGTFTLGERPGVDPPFKGFFGELNFYSAALTNTEVSDEEDRIATKYGLTI